MIFGFLKKKAKTRSIECRKIREESENRDAARESENLPQWFVQPPTQNFRIIIIDTCRRRFIPRKHGSDCSSSRHGNSGRGQ
mmetsp:Transcript_28339/g.57954  ORF Transcript_28339/g.57954 Transcript_28339/m.57954 type:complete len:82 (+) Transcript_28339:25-270(+)